MPLNFAIAACIENKYSSLSLSQVSIFRDTVTNDYTFSCGHHFAMRKNIIRNIPQSTILTTTVILLSIATFLRIFLKIHTSQILFRFLLKCVYGLSYIWIFLHDFPVLYIDCILYIGLYIEFFIWTSYRWEKAN